MAEPHVVLGVDADAGLTEFKRAYRRLAMRWHPDRNAHPEALERFKEIRSAYERLVAVDLPEDDDSAPAEDEAVRAADIRFNLELSLEEAAGGCRKKVRYARSSPCPTCAGSGEAGIARSRFCDPCHGSGRTRDGAGGLARCTACGGRGFFSERICPDCSGSGREIAETNLKVTVPPGLLPGDDLRVAGQGDPGDSERKAGDLFLTIVIASHPLFGLRGRDLHLGMPVSALALIGGGELQLPVLGGERIPLRLDPGLPEEREIRLPGHGFPGRGSHARGDLVVCLRPVFPRRLGARQRKLLLQADAALHDDADCLPEVAAWRKTHGAG